jgi:hypothetical protein
MSEIAQRELHATLGIKVGWSSCSAMFDMKR